MNDDSVAKEALLGGAKLNVPDLASLPAVGTHPYGIVAGAGKENEKCGAVDLSHGLIDSVRSNSIGVGINVPKGAAGDGVVQGPLEADKNTLHRGSRGSLGNRPS